MSTFDTGGTGHPVLLPARDGDGKCYHPSSGIMINSREERRTKALEGTEVEQQTPSNIRSEKPERTDTVDTNSHMRLVEFFACGSGGSPGYGGWPLIKINSFHNNIWFDFKEKIFCLGVKRVTNNYTNTASSLGLV